MINGRYNNNRENRDDVESRDEINRTFLPFK